jgi:hypothetical protein
VTDTAEQELIGENPTNLSTPKIDNIMTTFNNILSEQITFAPTVTSGETRTITIPTIIGNTIEHKTTRG